MIFAQQTHRLIRDRAIKGVFWRKPLLGERDTLSPIEFGAVVWAKRTKPELRLAKRKEGPNSIHGEPGIILGFADYVEANDVGTFYEEEQKKLFLTTKIDRVTDSRIEHCH